MSNDKPTYEELQARLTKAEELLVVLRQKKKGDADGEEPVASPHPSETDKESHAQEELQKWGRLMRLIAENTTDVIFAYDMHCRLVYVNDALKDFTGYATADLKERDSINWLHPEDATRIIALWQSLFVGNSYSGEEFRIVTKDGQIKWCSSTWSPIYAESGQQIGVQGRERDITTRKQAEETLKRRATQLTILNKVGQRIVAILDMEKLLDKAVQMVRESFDYHHIAFFKLDREKNDLVMIARAGDFAHLFPAGHCLKLGQGMVGCAALQGKTLWSNDVNTDLCYTNLYPQTVVTRSELSVPICGEDDVIGVLDIQSPHLHAFDENDVIAVEILADQIAIAFENARLFAETRSGRKRLQMLSQRLIEVQEAERRYIASELHDEIGQILTSLKLTLDINTRSSVEIIDARLNEAKSLIAELMARIRNMSLDLRPGMLDDLGLLPTLLWHFERYTTQNRIQVEFKCTGLERRRFPSKVETAVYRIVQEALTNVAKHAGGVNQVAVRLWSNQNTLNVQIEDQGVGFDTEITLTNGNSSGLIGMYERVTLLGGKLTIVSNLGIGTCVNAEFPQTKSVEEKTIEKPR